MRSCKQKEAPVRKPAQNRVMSVPVTHRGLHCRTNTAPQIVTLWRKVLLVRMCSTNTLPLAVQLLPRYFKKLYAKSESTKHKLIFYFIILIFCKIV